MSARADVRARLLEVSGAEVCERVDHLDASRRAPPRAPESVPAPDPSASIDFDVAIVGGGLWSILAPVLQASGIRVAIFDRSRVGAAHREWNASRHELQAIVDAGLVTESELEALIVARYDQGVCTFHGGGSYEVSGVLDQSVDAGALLAHARALSESRGVVLCDHHDLVAHAPGPNSVRLRFREAGGGTKDVVTKIMVDARGATSGYATSDLVCPTVGGVLRGLEEGSAPDEINPRVGEILATVDAIESGRQHVWEAFPGREGETALYLFCYARADEPVSLWELYERFFASRSRYKRGDAELVRPTFGFIPGWSRLSPAPRSPHPRIVLVGDAAGRHSPLTYCGFGDALRSLKRTANDIVRLLAEPHDRRRARFDAPIHALTGVLAHLMAARTLHGNELNTLLDAAFSSLHSLGNEPYAALLRDEMDPESFVSFLRATAGRHPAVWGKVLRGLGIRTTGRWGYRTLQMFVANH